MGSKQIPNGLKSILSISISVISFSGHTLPGTPYHIKMAPRDENQPDENGFYRRPRVNQIEEIPDEIPEWVKVSFLKFMVLLIIWFFFTILVSLCVKQRVVTNFKKIQKIQANYFLIH